MWTVVVVVVAVLQAASLDMLTSANLCWLLPSCPGFSLQRPDWKCWQLTAWLNWGCQENLPQSRQSETLQNLCQFQWVIVADSEQPELNLQYKIATVNLGINTYVMRCRSHDNHVTIIERWRSTFQHSGHMTHKDSNTMVTWLTHNMCLLLPNGVPRPKELLTDAPPVWAAWSWSNWPKKEKRTINLSLYKVTKRDWQYLIVGSSLQWTQPKRTHP